MKRRTFMIGAAMLAAGCATPRSLGMKAFRSDRISVVARGSGPDVVLIPGLGSSREVWDGLVAAVPGYRYHLVQLNGFAGEPVGGNAGGLVIAPVAEEIARYIRESGLKRPALIGHSMGGTLAMSVAARRPGLVSRLMVVDMIPFLGTFFGAPGTTAESVRPTADKYRDAMLARNGEQRREHVEAMIATMVRTEELRETAVGHSLMSDIGVTARAMHELIVTDLRAELGAFKGPATVLYVRAPNSPLDEAQVEALYELSFANLPQARLVRVPDSYHFIMWDQPGRFAQEVHDCLTR